MMTGRWPLACGPCLRHNEFATRAGPSEIPKLLVPSPEKRCSRKLAQTAAPIIFSDATWNLEKDKAAADLDPDSIGDEFYRSTLFRRGNRYRIVRVGPCPLRGSFTITSP